MDEFKVGQKVWYKYEGQDHVFIITEIKGNTAILETDYSTNPKIKTYAYLNELTPHAPCNIKNVIGRPTCGINNKD